MTWHTLAFICTIHAIALISPGPDFAVITRLSIVSGRRSGIYAAAGVATSIGIYVVICMLGLSVVLAALPGVSGILSVVGALYLAWLGIQCLRSKGEMPNAGNALPGGRAFLTGLLTNLLNPKAMLYFGSILSQVLSADLSLTDGAVLWSVLVAESMLWFTVVASLFSAQTVLAYLRRYLKWFERAIGVALLALAARVAASSR